MEELFTLLQKDKFFSTEKKVLVAFSGGPDSIFVFKLLNEYKKHRDFEIHLYHLNHNLRPTAARDEAFVKAFAEKNGAILHLESADIASYAKVLGTGTEEAGRIKRYESLKQIADEIGTKTVVTGHHYDDDVETMIMNFNRGTGLNGISGIKYREGIFFRPLLNTNKKFILEFLKENGIEYCVDETNFVDDVNRNKIRLHTIPELKKQFEDFDGSAKILLNNLKASQMMIEDIFEYFLKKSDIKDEMISISIEKMLEIFPRSRGDLYLYIIKKLNNSKKDVYSYHIEMIDEIIFSEGEKHLSFAGIEIIKSYDNLIFKKIGNTKNISVYTLEEGYKIGDIEMDADKIKGDIIFSNRKNGDRFETRGGRTKKLKELLIDEKIPKFKRDELVVVRDDEGIIYVEDLWLSNRVKPDNTTKNKIFLRRNYE